MNVWRWLSCGLLGLSCGSGVLAQSIAPSAIKRAVAELRDRVASGEVAGGSLLVLHRGEVIGETVAGSCDLEAGRPFRTDTLVRIYSMTKPLTSVAAMALFERGRFQLDDPVTAYIPAFAETLVLEPDGTVVPANRPITVRDVLRHTTGYSYGNGHADVGRFYRDEGMIYGPPHGMYPPEKTLEEAAACLARIPALHHPGERFTYGLNTDLLGRLIEIWSGKPFEVYMREALFEPLEMNDTGFTVPPEKRARFASCHTLNDGDLVVADKAETSRFLDGFAFVSGGGGAVSTLHDYGNFCRMLVDGGVFHGRRLLKKETLDLMFTDQLAEADGAFRFGLGFSIADVPLGKGPARREAAQYAWAGYASTDFRVIPEEDLAVILLRQRVPSSHDLANRLFSMIYEGVE